MNDEKEANERTVLQGKSTQRNEDLLINDVSCSNIVISPPGRTGCGRLFFAELALILYCFCESPLALICQRYNVDWNTKHLIERDALLNITHFDRNSTHIPCEQNVSDPGYDFQQEVQSAAAWINTLQSIIRGVPAVVSTTLLGAASDRLGRRFAIIVPICGMIILYVTVFVIVFFQLSIWYILIASFVHGCCGTSTGLLMGCYSYVADFTPQAHRAVRFGIINVCISVSLLISSVTLGQVISTLGYIYSIALYLSIVTLSLVYICVTLRDSPQDGCRLIEPRSESLSDVIQNHWGTTVALFRDGHSNNSLRLGLLLLTFVMSIIAGSYGNVESLFMMNYPLCWDLNMIGIYYGAWLASGSIGTLFLMPLLKLCLSDNVIALLASLADGLSMIYKFSVKDTLMMFFMPAFGLFICQFLPCIRSMIAEIAGKDKIGALFGVVAGVEIICGIIGSVALNTIYSNSLHIKTSFVFLVCASLDFIACIFVLYHLVIARRQRRQAAQALQPGNQSVQT